MNRSTWHCVSVFFTCLMGEWAWDLIPLPRATLLPGQALRWCLVVDIEFLLLYIWISGGNEISLNTN